eukprot:4945612-Amphidinium_carterae.1
MLPEAGLSSITGLTYFWIFVNHFEGVLPAEGLRGMTTASHMSLASNSFRGALPEAGLQGKTKLFGFNCMCNQFKGPLPERWMHRMDGLAIFHISHNHFAGVLPEAIFGPSLQELCICSNTFSGTLPRSFARAPALYLYFANDNYFQGQMPRLTRSLLNLLAVGGNLLAGTVPEGIDRGTLILSMSDVMHSGSMPSSLSRLSNYKPRMFGPHQRDTDTRLVFGHGLAGAFPRMAATLNTLSAWGNRLEGYLPELQFVPGCDILLHSNLLSCKLPRHGGQRARFAMALVGNHFMEPSGSYPTWIAVDEHSTFFCVSPGQGLGLVVKSIGGSILLCLAVCCALQYAPRRYKERDEGYDVVRKAWDQSFQLQLPFALASAVLLLVYNVHGGAFSCMVVIEHLHFPSIAPKKVQTASAVVVSAWMGYSSTCLSGAAPVLAQRIGLESAQSRLSSKQKSLKVGMLWNIWIILSTLISAPSVAYAAVKAIPGFIGFVGLQGVRQWFVDAAVSVLTAGVTGLVLPRLAMLLRRFIGNSEWNTFDLQLVARLL